MRDLNNFLEDEELTDESQVTSQSKESSRAECQ